MPPLPLLGRQGTRALTPTTPTASGQPHLQSPVPSPQPQTRDHSGPSAASDPAAVPNGHLVVLLTADYYDPLDVSWLVCASEEITALAMNLLSVAHDIVSPCR